MPMLAARCRSPQGAAIGLPDHLSHAPPDRDRLGFDGMRQEQSKLVVADPPEDIGLPHLLHQARDAAERLVAGAVSE